MKNYKILHEAKDHFVLHDANDNKQFKVAKKSLSEKNYQTIKSLPIHVAYDGGEVASDFTPATISNLPMTDNDQNSTPQPDTPDQFQLPRQPGDLSQLPPDRPLFSSALQPPITDNNPTQSVPSGNPDTGPQILTQQQVPTTNSSLTPGLGLQAQGINEDVKAKTDLGNKVGAIQDQLVKDQQAADANFQATHKALNDQTEQLYNDTLNEKVDPRHFWASKSTANQIGSAIAIALGGLAGGISGKGGNAAMDVVNKAIDNDIQAQRANLENKRSLLSVNLQRTNNLDQAYSLTKSQLYALAGAQVSSETAKAMGPEAKAQGDQLLGQLKNAASMQNAQVAQIAAKNALANGQGRVNPESLDKETRGRLVTLPDGTQTLTPTEKDAGEVRDTLAGADEFQSVINQMTQFRKDHPGGTVFDRAATMQAKALTARATTTINKLAGLARLSEAEIDQFKNQIPRADAFFQTDSQIDAQLKGLQSQVNDKVQATIRQRTEMPRRPMVTPTRKY